MFGEIRYASSGSCLQFNRKVRQTEDVPVLDIQSDDLRTFWCYLKDTTNSCYLPFAQEGKVVMTPNVSGRSDSVSDLEFHG